MALTIEALIDEFGVRRYTKCALCGGQNVWEIDGQDGKPPAKLCSWCDVEKNHRWSGIKA